MKIAIIGPKKEKPLILKEAEDIFEEALYVPINSVKLEVGEEEKVFYEDVDLSSFDIILPLLDETNREFMFLCLEILEKEVYIPFSSKDFFIIENDALMKKKLIKCGLKVRKGAILASNRTSRMMIENLKFPIIIRSPSGKGVRATNEETLKNVLSLFKAGYIRILEKPVKAESIIWCFVVGREVIASYEETKESTRSIHLDTETETKLFKIRRVIDSEFFVVNFIRKRKALIINDIYLAPDFSRFKETTGKDVSKLLLLHLKNKMESKNHPIKSLVISVHDIFKKLWEP